MQIIVGQWNHFIIARQFDFLLKGSITDFDLGMKLKSWLSKYFVEYWVHYSYECILILTV